ncbi:MAG: DUF4145 domain-containing protein [Candidatus Bathyarchaeia archaeon]
MASIYIKSFMCPHCHTKCSFFGKGSNRAFVLNCNGCSKPVYFEVPDSWNIKEDYPQTVIVELESITDYYPRLIPNVNEAIPKEVADDLIEAIKCENISASKATVTQCRRAMQTTCLLKGTPNADLIDQIDELEAKRIINPTLKDMAHTIRMIGNWGAHPQNDPLRDVTLEDASEILKFTSELLDEVFVRPARIRELKTKKGIT